MHAGDNDHPSFKHNLSIAKANLLIGPFLAYVLLEDLSTVVWSKTINMDTHQ